MSLKALLPLLVFAVSASAAADSLSGADALLGNLEPAPTEAQPAAPGALEAAPAAQVATAVPARVFNIDVTKLDSAYAKYLYSVWQLNEELTDDARAWIALVLERKYRAASRSETAVPDSFRQAATSARLYTLSKLGLSQTLFDEWVVASSDAAFRSSRAGAELNAHLANGFDRFLVDEAIQVSDSSKTQVEALAVSAIPQAKSLRALLALRQGEKALPALTSIEPANAFAIPLARTVALDQVRKGNLKGAAQTLKKHMEPALEAKGDPTLLASHYLLVARLLYQAGALEASRGFYEKVPNAAPQFLQARAELGWTLLKLKDEKSLRGELKTLSSPLFGGKFAPDVQVLQAISDIELCYYSRIPGVLASFQSEYLPHGRAIDQALRSAKTPRPASVDEFALQAERAVAKRRAELKLARKTSRNAVPALKSSLADAKSAVRKEYRRQWKNQELQLSEAIRKMRFVKIEYMTRVRELVANAAPKAVSVAASFEKKPDQMIFPFDGVMWPDELFKLQSLAQNQCLTGKGAKL